MYRSVEIRREKSCKDLELVVAFQMQFSQFIIANLRERFPDIGLLECFKALSPCCFPSGIAYKHFGYDMIEKLLAFYGETKKWHGEDVGSLIDKICAKREYDVFREQAPYEWKGRGLRETCLSIGRNPTTREKYPMLLRLAEIAMLQCSSTVACERGFSAQNSIKTKLRSHLSTQNLDALMRISIEGPSLIAYDFEDAIMLWRNGAKTSRHIFSKAKRVNGVLMDDWCRWLRRPMDISSWKFFDYAGYDVRLVNLRYGGLCNQFWLWLAD
ncbi:hypothetical protein L7F22_063001 [Adiantum nelumboides]|nr:hypothetical protein [Adiantum nelumboides]